MKAQKKLLSARFCEKNNLAVLSENENSITVGYSGKFDKELGERIQRYYRPEKTVEFQVISREELEVLIARLYSGSNIFEKADSESEREDEASAAKAAPAVNLLNSMISEGILKRASDIHIDVTEGKTKVRYRKDGKLFGMLETQAAQGNAVIARIPFSIMLFAIQ